MLLFDFKAKVTGGSKRKRSRTVSITFASMKSLRICSPLLEACCTSWSKVVNMTGKDQSLETVHRCLQFIKSDPMVHSQFVKNSCHKRWIDVWIEQQVAASTTVSASSLASSTNSSASSAITSAARFASLNQISYGLSVGWVSGIMLNSWGLGLRVEMHLLKEVLNYTYTNYSQSVKRSDSVGDQSASRFYKSTMQRECPAEKYHPFL